VHHESWAWPSDARAWRFRDPTSPGSVRLTVPLQAGTYRAVTPMDAMWTRPV
jgi:hypothetical protein